MHSSTLAASLSRSPSPPPLRPRALPLKFRRKSLTASDLDLDSDYPPVLSHSPPSAYSSSPPRSASYTSSSFAYPSSSPCAHDRFPASSSPFSSSTANITSSLVEQPRIRYQSSPILEPAIRARDLRDEDASYSSSHLHPYSKPAAMRSIGAEYAYAGYARPLSPLGDQLSYGYSYSYSARNGVPREPLLTPLASDIDLDASEDGDGPRHDHNDTDTEDNILDAMDVDFSHRRRISFSTSAERETPFTRPPGFGAIRTTSCPPVKSSCGPANGLFRKTKTDSCLPVLNGGLDSCASSVPCECAERTKSVSPATPLSPLPPSSPAMSILSLPSSDLPMSSPYVPSDSPLPAAHDQLMDFSALPSSASRNPCADVATARSRSSLFALLNPAPEPQHECPTRPSCVAEGEEIPPLHARGNTSLQLSLELPESKEVNEAPPVDHGHVIKPSTTLPKCEDDLPAPDSHEGLHTRLSSLPIPSTPQRVAPPGDHLSSSPLSPLSSPPFPHTRRVPARSTTSSFASSPLSSPPSSPRFAVRVVKRAIGLPSAHSMANSSDVVTSMYDEAEDEDSMKERLPVAGPSTARSRSPTNISRERKKNTVSDATFHVRKRSVTSTNGSHRKTLPKVSNSEPVAQASSAIYPKGEHSGPSQVQNNVRARSTVHNDIRSEATQKKVAGTGKRKEKQVLGPVRKRPRVVLSDSESETELPVVQERQRRNAKSVEKEDVSREKNNALVAKKSGKAAKIKEKHLSNQEVENNAPSTSAASKTSLSASARDPPPDDNKPVSCPSAVSKCVEPPLPLPEMQGMLIETLATSRASSLPASSLYNALISSRPALKESRSVRGDGIMSKKEWVAAIEDVLEAGCQTSGVFGKVENSVKDVVDHELEAQWFYVPERDEDQERATLIRSMMPRPGKRSETKKSKQYYWRPLGKISRWDPEDDL